MLPRRISQVCLCHGNLAFALTDNLPIPAPIKVTAMIVRVGHCFGSIARIHAVSSILQVTISEDSQASLSAISFSFADCLAISLSISFEILLSVTCA